MKTLNWLDAANTKPDSDQTVLCWGTEGYFCGYWEDSLSAWIGCESGGTVRSVTHWADPKGPDEPEPDNQLSLFENPDRLQQLETAAEFAFGCLWMIDAERSKRAYAAEQALVALLDTAGKQRGIKAACAAGFEADHPPGCDWWAGKNPECDRTCRKCGCTDADCSGCIERTGEPCYWVAADLCSACI